MKPQIIVAALAVSLAKLCTAANPFLTAADDRSVSAEFRGQEWGDTTNGRDIPLTARVVTRRIANMSWGAVFKIEFVDVKSRAKQRRQIPPEYFVATDKEIVLLNEQSNEAVAKELAARADAPEFEENNIYGLTVGGVEHQDGPWESKVEVKGDRCSYQATHASGHFKTVVWQRGVGLVEYALGYGAHADGFRLRRVH